MWSLYRTPPPTHLGSWPQMMNRYIPPFSGEMALCYTASMPTWKMGRPFCNRRPDCMKNWSSSLYSPSSLQPAACGGWGIAWKPSGVLPYGIRRCDAPGRWQDKKGGTEGTGGCCTHKGEPGGREERPPKYLPGSSYADRPLQSCEKNVHFYWILNMWFLVFFNRVIFCLGVAFFRVAGVKKVIYYSINPWGDAIRTDIGHHGREVNNVSYLWNEAQSKKN